MKNKKGFTLAELLGVITLLGVIAAITVPLVSRYITNSREKAYNTEITTLVSAAKNWFIRNSSSVMFDESGTYALNLDDLKKTEFLEDKDIIDPREPDKLIDGCIMILNIDDSYDYIYKQSCTMSGS